MHTAYRDEDFKVNIIAINWLKYANKLKNKWFLPPNMYHHYEICVSKVPIIGQYIASFIRNMVTFWHIELSKITVIAHSLGVHIGSHGELNW